MPLALNVTKSEMLAIFSCRRVQPPEKKEGRTTKKEKGKEGWKEEKRGERNRAEDADHEPPPPTPLSARTLEAAAPRSPQYLADDHTYRPGRAIDQRHRRSIAAPADARPLDAGPSRLPPSSLPAATRWSRVFVNRFSQSLHKLYISPRPRICLA